MKPKEIKTPADLIQGDYAIFVTWLIYKANPAKIEKLAVDKVFEPEYMNRACGLQENGLCKEWQPKRWMFQGTGIWDFRKMKWGEELYYSGRMKHKLYHLDQIKEAELFASTIVPKLQLDAVMSRIDRLKQDFTNKLVEMQKLEEILIKNCNTVVKSFV
jgi:hypothetical protein